MQKRITFETAKLAKEKGFVDGSINAFIEDSYGTGETCFGKIWSTGNFIDNEIEDFCLAPYQEDIQNWLREKHNIHIVIYQSNLPLTEPPTNKWEWGYMTEEINNPNENYKTGWYFQSYEEAKEAGIVAALKQI